MGEIKNAILSMIITLFGIFNPIKDFMLAMLILFAVNYVIGYMADLSKGGKWQWNKSWKSFAYATLFFLLAASILVIGKLMHADEKTVYCINMACWWAIYVFTVNILRNCRDLATANSSWHRFFSFIYFVLSMEGIKKIPYLKEWNDEAQSSTTEHKTKRKQR